MEYEFEDGSTARSDTWDFWVKQEYFDVCFAQCRQDCFGYVGDACDEVQRYNYNRRCPCQTETRCPHATGYYPNPPPANLGGVDAPTERELTPEEIAEIVICVPPEKEKPTRAPCNIDNNKKRELCELFHEDMNPVYPEETDCPKPEWWDTTTTVEMCDSQFIWECETDALTWELKKNFCEGSLQWTLSGLCPAPEWWVSPEGREVECEFYLEDERPTPEPRTTTTTENTARCTTGEARPGNGYHVCCAATCGGCGGVGCNMRPGGRDNCCVGTIRSSGKMCETPDEVGCNLELIEPDWAAIGR